MKKTMDLCVSESEESDPGVGPGVNVIIMFVGQLNRKKLNLL